MKPQSPESPLLRESLVTLDAIRLAQRWSRLLAHSPSAENNPPVLVLPGYLTGDWSTVALRRFLRQLGYDARGWRNGTNSGLVHPVMPVLRQRLEELTRATEHPATVIGWSHGGILAREVARNHPELVRAVITLGTPVIGGPIYTVFAKMNRDRHTDIDRLEAQIKQRESVPIAQPLTVMYSKKDAVVDWRACLDPYNDHAEHVELPQVSHAGMGVKPAVLRQVADTLHRLTQAG